ncbi:Sorting nexin-25 [Homo sapiens] [Rhizoctonia solani]|uniref:Sorting nexin-25 [Homo sapiens] n=1 Tax=Rhizoctonia solani TaxID=456999 RepID=A0A0K6GIP4_9AGAM|nr:Sorting nexin-25 [Homo sapiens] [Rhizoctonia solani]
MAEPIPEEKFTLLVVMEGENPYRKAFLINVPPQYKFGQVEDIIQEVYYRKRQISIYDLELYRGNVPREQVANIQLSDEAFLLADQQIASEWPSKSDVREGLVHIIVRAKYTHRTTTPPSPETEFDQFIASFKSAQLTFVQSASKLTSSSAAQPRKFRAQQTGPDYINIGRPAQKSWLPIVLYHPVFGRFLRRLRSNDPIDPDIYAYTRDHFIVSQELYEEDITRSNSKATSRDKVTRESLHRLLGDALQKIRVNGVEADGVITGPDASCLVIMEMKNEIGLGSSDPSIQAAESYMRYWSDDLVARWRDWCCCPSILIGIAGPWMCILGGIFLDRPAVQPLTDFVWVGDDPARPSGLDYVARMFDSLSQARNELDEYYEHNQPPSSGEDTGRPFPYLTRYTDSTGQVVKFAYRKALCPGNPEKAIFLAETDKDSKRIIVKFVQNYNAHAHELLAEKGLAPQLLYDGTKYPEEQPGPEHTMIVMEFIQGENYELFSKHSRLPRSAFDDIKAAVDLLHSHDYVFGDLRPPNVMVLQDSNGKPTGKAMLIDFDWCGKHGEGRYPLRMNLTLGFHSDVRYGDVMYKQHDIHMIKKLDAR